VKFQADYTNTSSIRQRNLRISANKITKPSVTGRGGGQ